ncbi:MAG: lysozyme [Cyanobacteria bacterium J06623_7]
MSSLIEQRKQAIALFFQHADTSVPTLVDYHLDSFLRGVLGLPDLPEGQAPYVGWMVGNKQSSEAMKISAKGVALIKRWEGCRLTAYQCSAHVWTIGYGHTQGVKRGDKITRRQAERLFLTDIPVYEQIIHQHVTVELNQNQFDALVSFVYNVGETAFKNSTLLKLLNQSKYDKAAKQLFRWVRAGGRRIEGLANRRNEEYQLFTK